MILQEAQFLSIIYLFIYILYKINKKIYINRTSLIPADTQHWNNVDSTFIKWFDVEWTLNRRCFNVVCLLGSIL